jgi:hypothetical protein
MGTATRKKPKADAAQLELPVAYGNVSIGEETASITAFVDRKFLTLTQADRTLCGKRLAGKITAQPGNDNPEQPSLMEDAGDELASVFDTRSFRVTPKGISFGLSFKIESVDVTVLAHFAKRAGRLTVESVSDIPEEDDGGEE